MYIPSNMLQTKIQQHSMKVIEASAFGVLYPQDGPESKPLQIYQ